MENQLFRVEYSYSITQGLFLVSNFGSKLKNKIAPFFASVWHLSVFLKVVQKFKKTQNMNLPQPSASNQLKGTFPTENSWMRSNETL